MEKQDKYNRWNALDILWLYIKEIEEYPLLSKEEERELFTTLKILNESKEDLGKEYVEKEKKKVKEKIINSNLRLVLSIANKYTNIDAPLLDLVQEGNLGLIKAVDVFDVTRGHKFSTIATQYIRKEIGFYFVNKQKTIRIPFQTTNDLKKLNKIENELFQKLERRPKDEEVLEEMVKVVNQPITIERIKELRVLNENNNLLSLDALAYKSLSNEEKELEDIIVDENTDVEGKILDLMENEQLLNSLKTLTERERNMILDRYGFYGDGKPKTLEQMSKKYGLSAEGVRIIIKKALEKIKQNLIKNNTVEISDKSIRGK